MGLSIIEKENYIYVKIEGDTLPSNEIEEKVISITRLCRDTKKSTLVHRITESKQISSMTDWYGFSQYLEQHWPREQKVSLVYPESMLKDQIDFFEMAAQNRGINIKLFASFEEAESWLLESS